MELLKISNNNNSVIYKDPYSQGEEFTRDLICLWFSEDNKWEMKINGELIKNEGWQTLGMTLKEMILIKEKSHRKKTIRRLVIWVNRLALFENVLVLALDKHERFNRKIISNFKQKTLLWISDEHIEFRNFDAIAGEQARRVKETYKFLGSEVNAMESYIKLQPTQNWARFRWTAAHCFEAQFYQRLNKSLDDQQKRDINFEISKRKNNYQFNKFIYNGGKAGIIWVKNNFRRKVLTNVDSYDISQAYGGQFVRADDFPLGAIYTTKMPKEEVMRQRWYAFVFEFDSEFEPPVPWVKPFENNSKWYCLLTKPDLDAMKIMGARFNENQRPRIKFQFICKEVGYLHFKVRELINNLYTQRQQMKRNGDKQQKILKQINEVIYGKGLQDRETGNSKANFRYFCPQISYHALAKTRLELIKMIDQLKGCIACDSDSIKTTDNLSEFKFNNRNKEIKEELARAGFPNSEIGTWKHEGNYSKFVQFEKKVYAYIDESGELVCKFAGCNRDSLVKWLAESGDMDSLMNCMNIPGGVVQRHVDFNLEGQFWVETKYLDYSLDEKEMLAFMNRRKIMCA